MPDNPSAASMRIEGAHRNHLPVLDLAGLGLTELPEGIAQLTNLEELYLNDNKLTRLPDSIGRLASVQKLYLGDNQLVELPDSIGQLPLLQELHLSANKLTGLPDFISELSELQALYLSQNQLTRLPDAIGRLTQLQRLDVCDNQLTELPESVGQLSQLASLVLSFNRLTALPDKIGQLAQLQKLDVSRNDLTELPDTIGQLAQLQRLDLSHNQLTELPESVGQLSQLASLVLSFNGLTALPDKIGQLAQLQDLDLSRNDLTELPVCLGKIGSLRKLSIFDNPKLGLPQEVLDRSAALILEYCFRIQQGSQPLNEVKLILVGRGGVGKTSIVNRLTNNRFDPREEQTDGIQISEFRFQLRGLEDVQLNIWDFGGQEIMHATHQFFLTQRSLYLLVISGREGSAEADAEYWLKLIESFGGGSPVIVVLNKIRSCPFDVNRRALQQKYTIIRDFIKTDCEDGTGFEKLRSTIEYQTDRLEHLRDAFPANWFTIKDQLADMSDNYLSFEEYRGICATHGERDPKAQETLALYLHSLGIVLNFKDDPRLQDTHVLNPHWVTNGIYRLLTSPKLEEQQGEIRLSDLRDILDLEKYPVRMHRFLYDLMKKFDLCFSFPDNDTHYLIPELLDKQQPLEASEFKPEQCLNFQYLYPILPEGLLPRFIVRTHMLSEALPRWRTGVILEFEKNSALVKADIQDKSVQISVSGPLSARRRLLAVIRSDFERIHHDIRNLQPQEMVPLPEYPDVVVAYRELLVMEESGVKKFPKVVGNKLIELDVHELLNGVDLEGARERRGRAQEETQAVRLFYSYSHKDETLRNELETHLKLLQRQGLLTGWHDRNIEAGAEWRQKIDDNLERADIILLLVSADFIASDYCYEKEMKQALERHRHKSARVIPVILRDVDWTKAPFGELQALPKDGLAVTKWDDKDSAWRNVSEGIQRVVEEMRKYPGRPY